MLRRCKAMVMIVISQIFLLKSFGQYEFSATVPSPNAASLGQYTDLPVSYFTGVPDISIPLYQVEGKKIKLPISMSYHAVGLRPDIHPGWVGNGWSLQAGGTITRKMKQMMDEFQYVFDATGNGQSYLRMNDWSSDAKVKANNFYAGLYPLDVEPDEFDFNFLGFSGKFFLDQNGVWQVQSNRYLKVMFELSDLVTPFINTVPGLSIESSNFFKTFGKFTLIDEVGNKYIFGSTDANTSAIEYSGGMVIPMSDRGKNNFFATSWHLSQIISADGAETINLNYERGPFTSQLAYSAVAYQISSPNCGSSTLPLNSGVRGFVVSPVYLSSIAMPSRNVQVTFVKSKSNELRYQAGASTRDAYVRVYQDLGRSNQDITSSIGVDFPSFYTLITSSSIIPYFAGNPVPTDFWDRFIWLKLDAMNVLDTRTGSTIQTVNFSYIENASKRLSLKRVTVDDKNYIFYYNPLSLPNYTTIYGDHWGFNNEGNHPNNAIPPFIAGQGWPSTNMYAIREPDATGVRTQAEILTDIFYPTGGKLHLEYEPNTYSSVVKRDLGTTASAESGIAGGLRVKMITRTNDFGPPQQTSYFYVNNYTYSSDPGALSSSGILDSKPLYNVTRTGTGSSGGGTPPVTLSQYNTSSVIPLTSNSQSNHIGYSTVVEKRSDGAYSIYQFSNHQPSTSIYNDITAVNSFNGGFFDGYQISTSNYFKRGKLLQRTEYTPEGNKVSEEINTYNSIIPEVLTNSIHQYGQLACMPVSGTYGTDIYAVTAYNIVSTPFLLSTSMKNLYSSAYNGNAVSRSVAYTYDQYRNVLAETSTNSQGQQVTTSFKYGYEYSAASNALNPFTILKNINNVSAVAESRTMIGVNIVKADLYSYKTLGANKVYSDAIYQAEMKDPVHQATFATTTSDNSGNLSFDSRYKKRADLNYDATGNVTSVLQTGNVAASTIWDYNGQLPTAKIVNANNIYGTTVVTGPVTQTSQFIAVTSTQYVNYEVDVYVSNGSSLASVNLSFAYNNPAVAGNNTSTLSWHMAGITDPNYHVNSSLCAATNGATCSSGSSTYTVNNVPTGVYRFYVTLVSVNGFSNYYGYRFNVSYPTVYQTSAVIANNESGHTSFEYTNSNELTYGTGNITGIQLGSIQGGASVTGDKYYALSPGNTLNKTGLDAGKTYLVTYWTNGSQLSVSGTQSSTLSATLSFGNWKCYQHKVSGVSSISVTGNAGIDELRIYPQGAQMTTYTYQPLLGMTSECSTNDMVTYYEYDSMRRLKLIRDKDKNILKSFEYKY